jgi:hypothetical protein
VQHGDLIARTLFGHWGDPPTSVVALRKRNELGRLRCLDAIQDERGDHADQDRRVQRQLRGGGEGDQHRDRGQGRDAQHQPDVGKPAHHELKADDEDQPADDGHRDDFSG